MTAETCDVAIIGGGIAGVSIAYHLTRAGARDVVVLEQAQVGSGSSLKAAGGIRRQFSTPANIEWSQRAFERFGTFADEFGADPSFHRCGYLVLASSERSARLLEESAARQRAHGVPVERLGAADVATAFPSLESDGLRLATLTADDGYADVAMVLAAVARAARGGGARVREGCGVRGIAGEGGALTLSTDEGELAAGTVVLAAGAWSARVAALAGLDVPVTPVRRELWRTGALRGLGPVPWTIDLDADYYFRPDAGGLLVSGDLAGGCGLGTALSAQLDPHVRAALERRVPAARAARYPSGWSGSIETTPDGGALIGPHPEDERVWLACGLSGHGFMHGLVLGSVVAEWLLDGEARSADPHPFRPSRFDEGGTERELLHQAARRA
jgi:sarcosine oxidase subunit beta